MGLFRRQPKTHGSEDPSTGHPGALDSGRRFSSLLPLGDAVSTVQQLIASYGCGPIASAEFTWHGPPDEAPVEVFVADITGASHPGDYLVISFRADGGSTEIGVFPEGSGDDRLAIPFAGNLKMLDRSLSSTGTVPGGQLSVASPLLGG